jgi:hypothetical protein
MRGRVCSSAREAIVPLTLLGSGDARVEVEAVIDTGFTGHLTLPAGVVRSLALPGRGFVEVELADGSTSALSVYDARVLWGGELLRRLRDDLRGALDGTGSWVERLNGWLEGYPMVARVVEESGEPSISYEPSPEAGIAGRILATVAKSVGESTWPRLKACPDCRWVFYDKSRSKTRVWCGMYAGKGGRACGTIAKVKRYRQKRRGTGST